MGSSSIPEEGNDLSLRQASHMTCRVSRCGTSVELEEFSALLLDRCAVTHYFQTMKLKLIGGAELFLESKLPPIKGASLVNTC